MFQFDQEESFPQREEKVLGFWKAGKLFEKSIEWRKKGPLFCFYDGPPFATGLPHYGHILAGTIKDTVTRWAYQTGHHVERRFGWGKKHFFFSIFISFKSFSLRLSWSTSGMISSFISLIIHLKKNLFRNMKSIKL